MEFYLIRHTTPDIDKGICYGQQDIALAESFPEDWKTLRAKLPDRYENFRIYSSPLKRCSKLAAELAKDEIITDESLMELDFGDWEGQAWDDINDEKLAQWMQDFVEVKCPGGESYRELYHRVIEWWKQVDKSGNEKVLVVSHAGVIRCLLSHILSLPLENSFRLRVDYGCVSKIVHQNNRNVIAYVNK